MLRHRGDKRVAGFGGATRFEVSQIFPPASVDLAALFYISYLFSGRWDHADGVALWNAHGEINPPGSIEIAYKGYQKWYKRVRLVGVAAAREKHLNPLDGTDLSWYGRNP